MVVADEAGAAVVVFVVDDNITHILYKIECPVASCIVVVVVVSNLCRRQQF